MYLHQTKSMGFSLMSRTKQNHITKTEIAKGSPTVFNFAARLIVCSQVQAKNRVEDISKRYSEIVSDD